MQRTVRKRQTKDRCVRERMGEGNAEWATKF